MEMTTKVDYDGPLAVGVDPGVSYGIAIMGSGFITVRWGRLLSAKMPGHAGHMAYNLIKYGGYNGALKCKAVVEGAAYHAKYGQVGLEEVRFGFFLALIHSQFDARIIPPATIKAKVLGNGRAQAGDFFPWMNHNAADAISAALYAQYL